MSELRWIKVDIDSRVPATGDYKLGWNDGDETFCEGLHKGEYFSQYSLTCAQNITHYAGPIVIADPEPELECLKEDSYTPMTPEVKRFIREIEEYTDCPRLTYSEFREWIQPRIAAIWNDPISPKPELELPDDWRVFHDGATVAAIEEEAEEEVMDFVHGLRRAIHTHCWRIAVKKRVSTGGIEDPEVAQIVVDDQSRRRCVLRINAAIKALEEE